MASTVERSNMGSRWSIKSSETQNCFDASISAPFKIATEVFVKTEYASDESESFREVGDSYEACCIEVVMGSICTLERIYLSDIMKVRV